MDYEPTEEEQKAYKKVIKAINDAKKLGITFYGLQHVLAAYGKAASEYINNHSSGAMLSANNNPIPYMGKSVLHDSGADDYYNFID